MLLSRLELFNNLKFNIYVKENDVYVNEYKIDIRGYPRMNEREWDIIKSRLIKNKISFSILGEKYSITKQRAQQIYKTGINKLKNRYINHLINLIDE